MALETHQNTAEDHRYLHIGPKGPYVPWALHTRIPTHADLRSGRHLHHLHHLLQTRYLLTGTRRNVNLFTTRLHGPLRCARTSSDRPSPPVRAEVRSWRLGWEALKDAIVALAHAFNLKKRSTHTRSVPRARLSEGETACSVSQCCAFLTQRVTVFGDHEAISTVWPLASHLNLMVSFYRYLFCRLLCSLCEIEDPCAAARFAVGSADRLLAVYLVQFVRLAAKRLVGKSLQLRKKYAGLLLSSIKQAKSMQLEAKSDFGKGCHTRSTEPYFYEAAYLHVRDSLSL